MHSICLRPDNFSCSCGFVLILCLSHFAVRFVVMATIGFNSPVSDSKNNLIRRWQQWRSFVNTHPTCAHTYTTELQSADGSLNAVLESPKVEGNRRRPRWKWSPISTQILTEAFKKVDSQCTSHSHALFSDEESLGIELRQSILLVLTCAAINYCCMPTMALLDSTSPPTLPWLYLIQLYSTMALLNSTPPPPLPTLPWLYLIQLHSTEPVSLTRAACRVGTCVQRGRNCNEQWFNGARPRGRHGRNHRTESKHMVH